jgi:hypothetical protein
MAVARSMRGEEQVPVGHVVLHPPQPDKVSRSSRSPRDTTQIKDPDEYDEALNLLQVNGAHHTLNTISRKHHVIVIDSGASMSGTGDRALLSNIRPTTLIVSSAFGDSAQPTEMGDLQPHINSSSET